MESPQDCAAAQRPPASPEFLMPAEWCEHAATWMAWPHNASDWPGKFEAVEWVFVELIRRIAARERVGLLVRSRDEQGRVNEMLARTGAATANVAFHEIKTDRNWLRDSGPIFVRRAGDGNRLSIARFAFNAWARYPDWQLDTLVPARIADSLDVPAVEVLAKSGEPIVLEGGAIDVNGRGTLLATEECLLDQQTQVRNPDVDRRELEEILCRYLGATNVLWLSRGIEGDDTHGHIDDVCRFVAADVVVACRESDPSDGNYRRLEENWERLQGMRVESGARLDVVSLPMPAPVYFDGLRLPASYANFYIANGIVLVPTFNDPRDRQAVGILAELFPDRDVFAIHALDLLSGGGAIHCVTQQQPELERGE